MNEAPRPTLSAFWTNGFMDKVIEKTWFGRKFIRFKNYFPVSIWLFTSGAVLGRSRLNQAETLFVIVAQPDRNKELLKYSIEKAEDRLSKYGRVGSFFELLAASELPEGGTLALSAFANRKMPVALAYKMGITKVIEGLGFGVRFPDITETMWRHDFERIDQDEWHHWWSLGSNIPEKPQLLSLEEREHAILLDVAGFVSYYYSELVEPLGLHIK